MSDVAKHPSEGIAELSRLLVNEEALEDTLQRVAVLANQTVEGTSHTGVTLLQDGRPATTVFTNPETPDIDAAQYETGVGPCLDAFRQQRVLRIDSTEQDERWPAFSRTALEHGVRSTISLPLAVRGNAIGALNLYSERVAAFGEEEERIGTLFAEQASIALANAQVYATAYSLTQQLQEALTSRAVIDQAKGILMREHGIGADRAFEVLREASQRENRKLRDLAQEMVDRTAGADS